MTLPPVGSLYPLVGATEQGSGWLYNLLTKAGVDPDTAKTVTDLVVRPLGVILVIITALVVARLGSKAVRRILKRFADRAEARSGSSRLSARMSTLSAVAANVWRFFVFVIAVAICLGIVGINLAPLLASATIIGATLGFGAQLIVRDYFSGFLLTLEDQYGIGDSITIGTVSGVVEDLTLRVTSVRAVDGTVYTIANGEIRQLANASRGRAQAVVDLTLPGSSAADLPRARAGHRRSRAARRQHRPVRRSRHRAARARHLDRLDREHPHSSPYPAHGAGPTRCTPTRPARGSHRGTEPGRAVARSHAGPRTPGRTRTNLSAQRRAELRVGLRADQGGQPQAEQVNIVHAAAIAACHMTSTGAGTPVHSSSCAAAWCTSMPSPSTAVAPASAAATSHGVGRGT